MVTGFPAWAGIDLLRRVSLRASGGLPRVGGDRPTVGLANLGVLAASPRGRG